MRLTRILRLFLFTLAVVATIALRSSGETINVCAAVSLREAMDDIAKLYQAKTGDQVAIAYGSTGQLAVQVENGAPTDVFVGAANKQLDDLSKRGLLDDATRRVIATNEMVLIVPKNAKNAPAGFAQLGGASVVRLAIGDPKTVPAGQYAAQVLKALQLGDVLAARLVYGANVRQVLLYVEEGEVSAGIVYATDAKQAGDQVRVIATAEPSWHEPIDYPAAVIKASTKKASAKALIEFMLSDVGQRALAARGFKKPPTRR